MLPPDEYRIMRTEVSKQREVYPEVVFSYKYRDPHVRNKWTLLNKKQVQNAFLEYPQMVLGNNPPEDYLMPPQTLAERFSRRIRHLLTEIF